MWLCTKYGFFSVKQDGDDRYFVRARRRQDLENLCWRMRDWWAQSMKDPVLIVTSVEPAEYREEVLTKLIQDWPRADYRYRLIVSKPALGALFAAFVDSIDYPNFKAEVAKHEDQRQHLQLYHEVWATMAGLKQ